MLLHGRPATSSSLHSLALPTSTMIFTIIDFLKAKRLSHFQMSVRFRSGSLMKPRSSERASIRLRT